MIDLLVKDLDKQIVEMETEEKDSHSDSAEKRAQESKDLTDMEGSKAALEEQIVMSKADHKDKRVMLMEVEEFLMELHKECDWLLKNFDLRKEARAGEVEALKQAKAVLSGADFSFVQKGLASATA